MAESRVLTPEEEWEEYLPEVLRHVQNGRVRWNPTLNKTGGFEWVDGRAFVGRRGSVAGLRLLITLWKALDAGLVRVDGAVVLLTDKGARR